MKSLKQEKLFESRHFKLHSDRLEMRIRNRRAESTIFIKYEDIGNNKNFVKEKWQPNYTIYVICRNLAIILLFLNIFNAIDSWSWFFASLSSAIVFFLFHTFSYNHFTSIEVDSDQDLSFLSSEPSAEEVDKFLENLYLARNNYLRKNYFESCSPNTENNLGILNWLLELNVIDRQEYNRRLEFIRRH